MQRPKLTIFTLTMINLATILSIKNWPLTAELGFSSVFYLIIGAVLFFIPAGLVSAELASAWPEKGGIFVWVKKALGHKLGFLAIWLLWVENIVYYPTVLSFIAGTLAFIMSPNLAHSGIFTFSVIVIAFWSLTFLNLRGIETSGKISTIGMIFGTLIPGALIICLGAGWYMSSGTSEIAMNVSALLPNFSNPSTLAFLAGIMLGYAGIEMPAVHAKDVINPQKSYPKAIFLSSLIIVVLSILGTLSVAIVIPQDKINLIAGGIEAISYFLKFYHMQWSVPLIALLVALGALGTVSTWLAGPCRGLLAAAEEGDLPAIFHKTNRHDMPSVLMIAQAIVVTLLSFVFITFPDVSTSFWILIVLASQLYLIMYFLMFLSAIVLRYKFPSAQRAYKVPFGNMGMWIVSLVGMLSVGFGLGVGFMPPKPLNTGNMTFFVSFLVIGIVVFCVIPFIIMKLKKPSWSSEE